MCIKIKTVQIIRRIRQKIWIFHFWPEFLLCVAGAAHVGRDDELLVKQNKMLFLRFKPWSRFHRRRLCQRRGTVDRRTGRRSSPEGFGRASRTTFTCFTINIHWQQCTLDGEIKRISAYVVPNVSFTAKYKIPCSWRLLSQTSPSSSHLTFDRLDSRSWNTEHRDEIYLR